MMKTVEHVLGRKQEENFGIVKYEKQGLTTIILK